MKQHQIIKEVFKEKNLHILWVAKLFKIAPSLKLSNITHNPDARDSYLLSFSGKKNRITFVSSNDPRDVDYQDMLGIYTCSDEQIQYELEMNGGFFGEQTNFSYSDPQDIELLTKLLAKFTNL